MNIRKLHLAHPEDQSLFRQGIHSLYVELFGESARPASDLFDRLERASERSSVGHWVFGAFLEADETELVALATLAESFAAFAGGPYLILGELWVAPDHRGRGVGAAMIRHCELFAKERGIERIDVTCPSDTKWDRTYSFYQRSGFVPTGRKLKLLCPDS